jgi:hypothetical protein
MKCWFLTVGLVLAAATARAQVDRATLGGTVRDVSAGIVQQADVSLTNLATGVTMHAATSAEGTYLAVNLAPGEWVVEASASGFQRVAQTIRLEVGQRARLDFSLPVGAIEQTVRVEGTAPLMNTESPVLGTVVAQDSIAKLPLAIRNWDDLLSLVAGVQGDRYTEESGGTATGRTGGVNVHGIRSLQNNFLLDGVDNNTISENVQELSTQVSRPSIDAINEFKVVTSPYSAEYGRAPGAAISVTTKAGANAAYGTLYDYFRNSRFDANTFFAERLNQPKPDNDQNQYGANLGGPIVRDRAFFFFDFEGTRIAKGVTRQTHVPSAAEKSGVFSSTITDPLTGQPFANNTIPAERIDPVGRRLLALFPDANLSGVTNNFFRQPNVEDRPDRYTTRVDFHLADGDNIFGRYIYTNRFRFIPGDFGGIADGTSTSAYGRQNMTSHGLVLGWTKLMGKSSVNEFRFSWARAFSNAEQDPFGLNGPSLIGLTGVPDDPRFNGGLPGTTLSACCRVGSPDFLPKFQHTNQAEFLDTLSLLKGAHQVKFGADVLAPMANTFLDIPATRASLTFNGRFTGNSIADLLLGYVSAAQLSSYYEVEQRHWAMSFFTQDDWKPSSSVTVTLGLRYDFITPALEAQNRIANFDPSSGTVVFARDGSLFDRGLVNPDKNNFAPRAGVVYRLDSKTILRGGYGAFYNLFDRIGSEDQLALNPPGLINNSLNTNSTTTPIFLLKDGFPSDFLSRIDYSRIRLRAIDKNAQKTLYHQMSGGFERQLGSVFVLAADYTATLGRNISLLRNLNQPLNGGGPKPFPSFGDIEWRENTGESTYNGIDVTLERRMRNGYSVSLAYTLSKSTDQAPEHLSSGGSGGQQDTNNSAAWVGPSDFDTRHRVVGTFIVELPFGDNKPWATAGPARAILGGWLVSGIYTARTGRPFTVTQGNNNVGSFATGLPNRIGDGTLSNPTADRWFDPSAFQLVPSGTFGNAGRNILEGPGWVTFDLSVQRRIPVSRANVALRWDVFNVFNRANFGLPNRDLSNASTVATITSLAGDPRIMQFSARISF